MWRKYRPDSHCVYIRVTGRPGRGTRARTLTADWDYHKVGQVKESRGFIRAAWGGVDKALGSVTVLESLQALRNGIRRQFHTLRDFCLALLVPSRQRALRVCVYQKNRAVPGAFGFHGKVSAQRRFAASPFLRVNLELTALSCLQLRVFRDRQSLP